MGACTCTHNVCAWCRREIADEFGAKAAREFQPDTDPPQTLEDMDREDAAREARARRRAETLEAA